LRPYEALRVIGYRILVPAAVFELVRLKEDARVGCVRRVRNNYNRQAGLEVS
jgi:hypothetical protein